MLVERASIPYLLHKCLICVWAHYIECGHLVALRMLLAVLVSELSENVIVGHSSEVHLRKGTVLQSQLHIVCC